MMAELLAERIRFDRERLAKALFEVDRQRREHTILGHRDLPRWDAVDESTREAARMDADAVLALAFPEDDPPQDDFGRPMITEPR